MVFNTYFSKFILKKKLEKILSEQKNERVFYASYILRDLGLLIKKLLLKIASFQKKYRFILVKNSSNFFSQTFQNHQIDRQK